MTTPSKPRPNILPKLDSAIQRAATPKPVPAPRAALQGLRSGTGSKLMEAFESLAETLAVQASQNKHSPLDRDLVKSARDLAAGWAQVHGEMRASLQALTNEEYVEALNSLSEAAAPSAPSGASDPLLPPRSGTRSGSYVSPNFAPLQDPVASQAAFEHAVELIPASSDRPAVEHRADRLDPFDIEATTPLDPNEFELGDLDD